MLAVFIRSNCSIFSLHYTFKSCFVYVYMSIICNFYINHPQGLYGKLLFYDSLPLIQYYDFLNANNK